MELKESPEKEIATIFWRKIEPKKNEKNFEMSTRIMGELEKEFPKSKIIIFPKGDNIMEIQLHPQDPSKSKDLLYRLKTAPPGSYF